MTEQIVQLPIASLRPSADNPRRALGNLDDLAASIRESGVLQPLVVTPNGDGYQVLSGHRRHAAAARAGLVTVPAIVRHYTGLQRQIAMLIDNLHRKDLPPSDEARAYQALIAEHGLTQRQLADMVGRSQGHIAKRLALLRTPGPGQPGAGRPATTPEEIVRKLRSWPRNGATLSKTQADTILRLIEAGAKALARERARDERMGTPA